MAIIESKDKIEYVPPVYSQSFQLTDAYYQGVEWAREVHTKINGGMATSPEDAALMVEVAWRLGHCDHLELGALFGGSAILMALAKERFGFEGQVWCVDNFTYMSKVYPVGPEMIYDNAAIMGVNHRIKVFRGNTYPLPPDITNHSFGSSMIDAAHDFGNCQRDWLSVEPISKVVAFHDYDRDHMGVVSAVRNAMQIPGWWLVHISHHTAIFERMEL